MRSNNIKLSKPREKKKKRKIPFDEKNKIEMENGQFL